MRVGLFASLVDKIQFSYGWDDEQVLNLTLRRAVQIQEAITQREEFRTWETMKISEWQTKSLGTIMANIPESKEARKQLNKMVDSMSITGTNKNKFDEPDTYKTLSGRVIDKEERKNYTYENIDHSEEEARRAAYVRKLNAGKNTQNFSFTM